MIQTEVAVIGAGYAGIAAAQKLQEAGKEFVVLEARDRIGGRTHTQALDCGATVEMGAQWIGPTQQHMWDWVKSTNTETYDTYDTGKNILSWKDKISTYTGVIPKVDPVSLIDLGLAISKINKLSSEIDIKKPWAHPKAAEYDSMTVQGWMDKHMFTKKGKHLFGIGVSTVFAEEASSLSLLHALFYARSGDNMDALISIPKGAQQTLLKGGTQGLLQKIAGPFSDKIKLNNPVRQISQDADGVTITTDSLTVRAKKLICAIPPTLIGGIRFDPTLPQKRAQLIQRVPMGAAMKCFVVYETPFWRKLGFSGQIVSDAHPVKVTFDCSYKETDNGVLLVFVEGHDAREFVELPLEDRKRQVLQALTRYFGDAAARPIAYTDKCWTEEEWTRGCYVGNYPPGVLTQFGEEIRKPFMHMHFAGTETAMRWNGYMDGAIESGFRAADEAMELIR